MTEIWKDIKGYEGLYQISNFGRVKSLARYVVNNKNGGKRLMEETLLHPSDNGNGYKIIGLRKSKVRKNHYIHRLVAEHFLRNPNNKKYVNHLDYNRANNAVTNLEWCTQKENIGYSIERMKKPKTKCKQTNTGEKYISERRYASGNPFYRVHIRNKQISKQFNNLSDAINFRDEVMLKWQNQ